MKMKLTRNGMQYFDDGGQVQAQVMPTSQPLSGQSTTAVPRISADAQARQDNMRGIFDPTRAMNPNYNIENVQNALSNPSQFFSDAGQTASGLLSGLSGGLTVKNNYQAQLAPVDYSGFGNTIQAAGDNALNGYGQTQSVNSQQQGLADALRAQSMGQGPNPVQSQFAQNTGQNVANQAALMAGQRGAAANVGLIARQAGQQGAAIEQNAAGQAATQQAAQQLAAQQAQANVLNQIGQTNIAQQNASTNLFGTAGGLQNTQNANSISNYGMAQGINSSVAQNNANAANKTQGGILGGIGSAISSLFAKGGEVSNPKVAAVAPSRRFEGALASHIDHMARIYHPHMYADGGSVDPYDEGGGYHGDSGKVASVNLPSSSSSSGDSGGGGGGGGLGAIVGAAAALLSKGGPVPGQPRVNKNDYKNDTVPAMLTPKEIVLPLSVTQSENPGEAAKAFVEKLKGKYGASEDENEFKASLKKAMINRKVK